MDHSPGFLRIVNDARAHVRELSVEEAHARLQKDPSIRLLDIREDREWALGHITGAEHLGKGILERDVEKRIPNKDTGIILYCGGGFRSVLSAEALGKMGYTNVYSMNGGWRGWVEAGKPVELESDE